MKSGGSGDFGGAGASGTFDGPMTGASDAASSNSGVGDSIASIAEVEKLAIPLLAVGMAVGLAFASTYIIYIAPTLFAEVLVDGAFSYALYRSRHPEAKQALMAWCDEVKKARWARPSDIKAQYASASILKSRRVVFNLKGNDYRLIVAVAYNMGFVYVKFVGTHAEFDAVDANTVEQF